jgi:hypothetical protein
MCLLVESAARASDLPVEFFARVIWRESRFRADAVGPVTRSGQRALGIAQFMPGTAAERNLLDPFDPIQALPKSAGFLNELRREFGNLGLASAAYNAGPRRVREWLDGTGSMPSETRAYVLAVTGQSVEQWSKAGPDFDRKPGGGPDCAALMAMLKREPGRFVAALEQRIVAGEMQPWGAILGSDRLRARILDRYAALQQRAAIRSCSNDDAARCRVSRFGSARRHGPAQTNSATVSTNAAAPAWCCAIRRDEPYATLASLIAPMSSLNSLTALPPRMSRLAFSLRNGKS